MNFMIDSIKESSIQKDSEDSNENTICSDMSLKNVYDKV